MKQWKENLASAIICEAAECKIVSLREIANRNGIKHITSGDVRDILHAVEKQLDGFYPVRLMNTPNDSLFCSLCFVEKTLDFSAEDDV